LFERQASARSTIGPVRVVVTSAISTSDVNISLEITPRS
jgi:hypothetical protein